MICYDYPVYKDLTCCGVEEGADIGGVEVCVIAKDLRFLFCFLFLEREGERERGKIKLIYQLPACTWWYVWRGSFLNF